MNPIKQLPEQNQESEKMESSKSLRKIRREQRKGSNGAQSFNLDRRFHSATLAKVSEEISTQQEIINWMKNPKHFFVYLGNPGVGKTYICAAMLNFWWDLGDEIYYIASRHFFQDIQDAIKQDKNQYSVIQKLASQDIIIFDDLGAGRTTEWQTEMILEFVDLRYNSMKPTIITSNLNEKGLTQEFGHRISSRIFASENLILENWSEDKRKKGL